MNNYQKLESIHCAIQEALNGNVEELTQALELVEELREKEMEKEKVSVEEVKHWLGSDWSFDDVCETLQELANGVYKQNQLLEDIKNTAESTGFYTKDNI
jgi:phenylalanyl-tRNA synthetase beta subunit|tara:strand:+ start:1256 stop:1555 length:300 start_codon:yes stop_codon:yes gene_type:complete